MGTYRALSYTWGRPHDTRTITVNGCRMQVRKNLFDFLEMYSRMRATSSGIDLWVDAICIHQEDNSERNQQVQAMGKIYSHAEHVVAWLGPSTPESDLVAHYLSCDCSIPNWLYLAQKVSQATINAGFMDLESRTYWCRIWIVQEVFLGRSVVFWVGERHIPGLKLERYSTAACPNMTLIAGQLRSKKSRTLEQWLRTFSKLHCEDTLDKVYALLGLVDETVDNAAGLEVKYEDSREELFARTLTYCRPKDPLDFALFLESVLGGFARRTDRPLDLLLPVKVCFRALGTLGEFQGSGTSSAGLLNSSFHVVAPLLGEKNTHSLLGTYSIFMHERASCGDLIFPADPVLTKAFLNCSERKSNYNAFIVTRGATAVSIAGSVRRGWTSHPSANVLNSPNELQKLSEKSYAFNEFYDTCRFSLSRDCNNHIVLEVATNVRALLKYAATRRS